MIKEFRLIFTVILLTAAITACQDNKSSNQLKITLRNSETQTPVSGVKAILYNQDNISFDQDNVRVSGDDGVVDFGDVGRNRISLSLVYKSDAAFQGYQIDSFVEIAPWVGDYSVYIYNNDQDYCENVVSDYAGSPLATINVDFSGLPAAAVAFEMINPGYFQYSLASGTPVAFNVCPEDAKDNGKVNLVANIMDETGVVIGYAYALDKAPVEGATYTLTFADNYSTASADVDQNVDIEYVGVGLSNGIDSLWGTYTTPFSGNTLVDFTAAPGKIQFRLPAALEANNRIFTLLAHANGNTKNKVVFSGNQKNSIDLTFADINIEKFSNSEGERVIRWSTSGNARPSFFDLSYSFWYANTPGSSSRNYDWHIYVPPAARSWNIMNLPLDDMLVNDLPSELTRQRTDGNIDHQISAFIAPQYKYQDIVHPEEYYRHLFSDTGSFMEMYYESTAMSFAVDANGIVVQ